MKPKKPSIVAHRVESSDIYAVGYEKLTGTLGIAFKTGKIYLYESNPKEYTELLDSKSKGRWVFEHLRSTERPFTIIDPSKEVKQKLELEAALKKSIKAAKAKKDGKVLSSLSDVRRSDRTAKSQKSSGSRVGGKVS